MTIEIQTEDFTDSSWNKRLVNTYGSIHQTREYAKFTESALGWNPLFILFLNPSGKIVGQLMLSRYSRFDKKDNYKHILNKIPGIKKSIYRWVYGPVIFDPFFTEDICTSLGKFLLAKKCRVSGTAHPLSNLNLSLLGPQFQSNSWSTFLIDLRENIDTLKKKLDKHSAQKNIERSHKHGIVVKEMSGNDIPLYHKLLNETKAKIGDNVELFVIENLWKNLHPLGLSGFIAYENDIPVGGIIVSPFNNYVNEWGVARSDRDTIGKLYSQDLLKWKIIEWGVEKKFHYYDLSGVNPDSQDKKELGIYRYKQKWGGDLIKYSAISL